MHEHIRVSIHNSQNALKNEGATLLSQAGPTSLPVPNMRTNTNTPIGSCQLDAQQRSYRGDLQTCVTQKHLPQGQFICQEGADVSALEVSASVYNMLHIRRALVVNCAARCSKSCVVDFQCLLLFAPDSNSILCGTLAPSFLCL